MKNKIKKIIFLFFLLYLFFNLKPVFSQDKLEIYFFWGKGCSHCAQEKLFLEKMKEKYPRLEIKDFEIFFNEENKKLFEKILDAYKVNQKERGYVPFTFIGKNYILGFATEETTGKEIESLIENCFKEGCFSPAEILKAGGIEKCDSKKSEIYFSFFGKKIKVSSQSSFLFLGVILGLADGINPCMFSVLLFLLTYLLAIGSRKRAIKVGLVFSLGVFIVYFLFMLGMINLISLIGVIQKVKIIIATVALLASLILIKDFFAYGKWVSLEIPEKTKPLIEKMIKKGTIPSAILLAFFSSLVELPCTAGIPLIYTTLLAQKEIFPIPYLLWYNLFFVAPLFFIISGVAFAWTRVEKIEKWRVSFRKYMRLFSGLILLFLALSLFFG